MRRRSDSIALAILYVTLAQLGVGLMIVRTVHGQTGPSQEVINDRLENRQQAFENRIQLFEQMHLPERLAVLERASEELSEVRKLIYGVFLSLVGILIAQIVQIRGQRRFRRVADEDTA